MVKKFLILVTIAFLGVMLYSLETSIKTVYSINDYSKNLKKQCCDFDKKDDRKEVLNWEKIKKINPDIVGWIKIPDTPVDYPIVQTQNNQFYLNHNVNKEYSSAGSIFIDESLYGSDIFNNHNVIVYGHNMGTWTNIMFSSLYRYLQEDYYKKHKDIYINTYNSALKYEIISVFKVQNNDNIYTTHFGKGMYKKWLESQLKRSIYDIYDSSHIEYTLTLSTCTYASDKLIILAKRQSR